MKTRLTQLLGIEYPILQGGMAWVSEGTLAAAVSNAGGAGIIAGGNATVDSLREQIRKAKGLTDKPFGVNIALNSVNCDDLVQLTLEEWVSFVTTGAGDPSRFIPALKAKNIKVIPVIPSVRVAKKMELIGADAVVAEGTEAGGHIGETSTLCLVPQVVDAVSIPVLAAGGIADGRGVAAAFMLGAAGVQVGTRFLAAEECRIHPNFKQLLINAGDTDHIVTGRYFGHPVRNLKTDFTKRLLALEMAGGDKSEFERLTVGSIRKAAVDGNLEEGTFGAGAIAGMIKDIKPAARIIEEMFAQAEALLKLR